MAVQNACQDELFQRVNFVTFTSSGTYTPPANLAYLHVLAVGAGAGRQRANGSSAADHVNAGNSGGGAQVGHALLTAAEVGASVNITVASAGISASPQSGPGGTTIVGVTTPLSAAGGQGLVSSQLVVLGTNPPGARSGAPVPVLEPNWDVTYHAGAGVTILAFNRWPNRGTNFRLFMSANPGRALTSSGTNFRVAVFPTDDQGGDGMGPGAVQNGVGGIGATRYNGTSFTGGGTRFGVAGRGAIVFLTEYLRG
jgi:hypothetical protein